MVIKPEIIIEKLKQIDTVLQELSKYQRKTVDEIAGSLSLRWTIERGLIAAANLIFDVADHILGGHFGIYPETFEESLRLLKENQVISSELYQGLKGLGDFRNILVHEYLKVDMTELSKNFAKAFRTFPEYSQEVQEWLRSNNKIGKR